MSVDTNEIAEREEINVRELPDVAPPESLEKGMTKTYFTVVETKKGYVLVVHSTEKDAKRAPGFPSDIQEAFWDGFEAPFINPEGGHRGIYLSKDDEEAIILANKLATAQTNWPNVIGKAYAVRKGGKPTAEILRDRLTKSIDTDVKAFSEMLEGTKRQESLLKTAKDRKLDNADTFVSELFATRKANLVAKLREQLDNYAQA